MDDNTLLTHPVIWHLIAGLQYCSDKKSAIARAPEGREGGSSSFNMAADKVSEWIQPTWTPQPGSPYLPIPFFLILLHPYTSHSELQISPCVSLQARWEIRSKSLSISAIWACCSFGFIYFIPGIYLSLCHRLNVWFLVYVHMNARGFSLVKVIKMDRLFVCVIWLRLRCIQACT